MMQFFIGTTNEFKVREFASVLRPLGIPLTVTGELDPEETGQTLEENSQIKAMVYGKHIGDMLVELSPEQYEEEEVRKFLEMSQVFVISDDSGIEIPALGGLPGPWSARFDDCVLIRDNKIIEHESTGRNREEMDLANNERVLKMMKSMSDSERKASFGVCLTVADTNGKILYKTSHRVDGWVSTQMRGVHGFGYDPIFESESTFGKTWAEIDPMRKNLISHRRCVSQEFTKWIMSQSKDKII